MQPSLFCEETPKTLGKLVLSITISGRLPSWNEILGMEHWARYKFKKDLADAFMSELRAIESDSSTKTISARSTTLTYSATLERYLEMRQRQRALKSAKKRLDQKNQSELSSKSTKSKVPF